MSIKSYYVIRAFKRRVALTDIVFEYTGDDHGIAKEDTFTYEIPFKALTKNRDGSGPFFTVPEACIIPLTMH